MRHGATSPLQVVTLLEAGGYLTSGQLVTAREAMHAMLLDVHDAAYLQAINTSSLKVAQASERSMGQGASAPRQPARRECLQRGAPSEFEALVCVQLQASKPRVTS